MVPSDEHENCSEVTVKMELPFAVPDHPTHDEVAENLSTSQQDTVGPLSAPRNGGLMYNNLIPGHYRYGTLPARPPPGPLHLNPPSAHRAHVDRGISHKDSSTSAEYYLQVSEPEEDEDDLLLIAAPDLVVEEEDDEKYYRPFRHANTDRIRDTTQAAPKTIDKTHIPSAQQTLVRNPMPFDLLTVLLSDPVHPDQLQNKQTTHVHLSELIEEAAAQSRKARAMTNALASKQNHPWISSSKQQHSTQLHNNFYVDTANAHTDAATSYQRVYRALLGWDDATATLTPTPTPTPTGFRKLSPMEELAKSMIVLANGHVRMAASLATMGKKWNMGTAESFQRMTKSTMSNDTATNAMSVEGQSHDQIHQLEDSSPASMPQHERLRMAVRGALDTAHHEDDLNNSTFLARSTLSTVTTTNKGQSSTVVPKNMETLPTNALADCGGNPVDDLMKLEKELQCMDMALEMGNSVASLGAPISSKPDGSFCVVPPGSSYMSSSSMWTSGVIGPGTSSTIKQERHVSMSHKGTTDVRSRANHLQNFLGGGKPPTTAPLSAPTHSSITTLTPSQPKGEQVSINAGLDQSWWGGGQGSMMSSVLASSAILTATASHQRHANTNHHDSANTKQLMQLMDSLNRLGNENAQLMREVEEAKVVRAEAKTTKKMMEQFKMEYNQKFLKVKEALEKYSKNGTDNPVNNSSYMKSETMMELQKRDQMIKKLAADLRKEREEAKKKDAALRKYEGFYREVKARSAEKARQRQIHEGQKKLQLQQQQQQQQLRSISGAQKK